MLGLHSSAASFASLCCSILCTCISVISTSVADISQGVLSAVPLYSCNFLDVCLQEQPGLLNITNVAMFL